MWVLGYHSGGQEILMKLSRKHYHNWTLKRKKCLKNNNQLEVHLIFVWPNVHIVIFYLIQQKKKFRWSSLKIAIQMLITFSSFSSLKLSIDKNKVFAKTKILFCQWRRLVFNLHTKINSILCYLMLCNIFMFVKLKISCKI